MKIVKHSLPDSYDHGIEKMIQEDEVVRIGYRSSKTQVEEFLTAGIALAKARGEHYLYAPGEDDDEDNLAFSPYPEDPVDVFDALEYQKELKKRKEELKKQKQAELKANQSAPTPPADTTSPESTS